MSDADQVAFTDSDFMARAQSAPHDMAIAIDRILVERGGLRAFTRLAWHTVEGTNAFLNNWHIDAVCEHLEAVSRGEIRRLAIAIPPRSMKSTACAVMWPAWDWITLPERRFLFSSYAHNLAIRDSRKCRQVMNSPWYKARWGDRFRITSDQNTKIRFDNNAGGYRLSTSVKSQVTGEGGDIVCLPWDELVQTEHGLVEIGRLVDERREINVWSCNTETGAAALRPITGWHRNPGREIVRVTLSDGSSFRCTPDHRIWTAVGWRRADELRAIDMLPIPTLPDADDRRLRDAVAFRQNLGARVAPKNCDDLLFVELGVLVQRAAQPVVGTPGLIGDGAPCGPVSNLLDCAACDPEPGSQDASTLLALSDSNRVLARELGPGLGPHFHEPGLGPLFHGLARAPGLGLGLGPLSQARGGLERFGIIDVLRAGAIAEVGQPGIPGSPVAVSDLFTVGRLAHERQHDDQVDEQRVVAATAAHLDPWITFDEPRFHDPLGELHGPPAALDHAGVAPDAPQVRDAVVGETRYRFPVLVESVGHVDETFCLSVAGYHNFMITRNAVTVANCVDDPHNVREAESTRKREGTLEWWDEAMSSRLNDPQTGAFVIIQQRVHESDLLGHVLRQKMALPYTYLCLPQIYESDHPNRWFRDPRKEGGLLWPARIRQQEIDEFRAVQGPYAFAGQQQQRPAPREGGYFKRTWFKIEREAPADCTWSRAWDLAATEEQLIKSDPDWTATAKVGFSRSMGKWYIKHVQRWRVDPHKWRMFMLELAKSDGKACKQTIPREPSQAGKDQSADLVRMYAGYQIQAEPQTGDKLARATPFAAQAGAGHVVIIEDQNWNDMFLNELTSFPTGNHDDMVDAVASAFNRLTDGASGLLDFYRSRVAEREQERQQDETTASTQEAHRVVKTDNVADLARALLGDKFRDPDR